MDSFLNEKVNIIVATKSGSSMTGDGTGYQASSSNVIKIRGTLTSIDKTYKFAILENTEITESPQISAGYISDTSNRLSKYNYKKTAINLDTIITISIV